MKLVALLFMFVMWSSTASAQPLLPADSPDPVATAPIRIGAFGVDPRLRLSNFGVDTNVFNVQSDPQKDLTFTLTPGTNLWLRTGRGLLSLSGDLGLVYFNEFETERSVNSNVSGTYELRLNRLRPYVSASHVNSKQRPGYEIDVRARHYETEFHTGLDVRLFSKSTLRADVSQTAFAFDGEAIFAGRPLNQELNRTLRAADLSWRQRLTPLTTWITRVSRETERFEFENIRNSDSFRVSSGFELGRLALIRGSAFAGFRKLEAADGGVIPPFSGITASVDASYTAPTQTRLSAAVDRDVQYSFDRLTPYYIQTSWTGTLTQRITGRFDAQLTGGRDRLGYRGVDQAAERTDFVGRFGGGIGYNLNNDLRVSFDVNSFYRSSAIRGREYGAIRAGVSVTYGN